jgi:hypothetical protein
VSFGGAGVNVTGLRNVRVGVGLARIEGGSVIPKRAYSRLRCSAINLHRMVGGGGVMNELGGAGCQRQPEWHSASINSGPKGGSVGTPFFSDAHTAPAPAPPMTTID